MTERPWPPRTVREWIALARFDSEQPTFWKGDVAKGCLEALDDLECFLDFDWSRQLGEPGEGDVFPARTEPPPIGETRTACDHEWHAVDAYPALDEYRCVKCGAGRTGKP